MPLIRDVIAIMEEEFPPLWAEEWDHSGLQVGDADRECTGVLIAVEATEATVQECVEKGCNLLITHHPILFHPLYRLTPHTYQERTVSLAIRENVVIYAAHTNADNAFGGLNRQLLDSLDLPYESLEPLEEKKGALSKLSIMVPTENKEALKEALFAAGAGHVGAYEGCAFTISGEGQFRPLDGADPYIGDVGEVCKVEEACVSVLVPHERMSAVLSAMIKAHPYEEPAYDKIPLQNGRKDFSSGLIASLKGSLSEEDVLKRIALLPSVTSVAHSKPLDRPVQRIAIVTGSGGSFLNKAMARGVDVLLTGEARYNDYLDAQGRILLVVIGHWESERIARELFHRVMKQKMPNFAFQIADSDNNPIHYRR